MSQSCCISASGATATVCARGLRPIQLWIPNTRAPGFAAEAHRQSQNAAATDAQDSIMDWIEEVSWLDEDAG